MIWHRQGAFQIQYGIFEVNSNKVKQTEQDVPNPSENIFLTWLFYFPLVPIYASVNLVSIDLGNGFLPVRCLAIAWTSADL